MAPATNDNAALRLSSILNELQFGSYAGVTVGAAIQDVVGGKSVARSVSILFSLLDEVHFGLESLRPSHSVDAYLVGIQPIDEWLSTLDLRQPWANQPNIDPRAIAALVTCSDQLRSLRQLAELDDATVASFGERIDALLDEVVSPDSDYMETDLRLFLIQHLQAIRSALQEYRVRGSFGISEAVRLSLGTFGTDRPEIKTDQERSLWRKFVEICKDLIVVTTLTVQLATAPVNVLQAYEKLDNDRPTINTIEQPALQRGPVAELGPGTTTEDTSPEE